MQQSMAGANRLQCPPAGQTDDLVAQGSQIIGRPAGSMLLPGIAVARLLWKEAVRRVDECDPAGEFGELGHQTQRRLSLKVLDKIQCDNRISHGCARKETIRDGRVSLDVEPVGE